MDKKQLLNARHSMGKTNKFLCFGIIGRTISTIDARIIPFFEVLTVVSKCAWAILQTKTF